MEPTRTMPFSFSRLSALYLVLALSNMCAALRLSPSAQLKPAAHIVRTQPPMLGAEAVSKKACIVGGGPAGLLSAIMLARRGWEQIEVLDVLAPPPKPDDPTWAVGERSYQLGLNGRGQNSLAFFDCLDAVDPYAAFARGRLSFVKVEGDKSSQKVRASPSARSPTEVSAAGVGSANGYTPTESRLKAPGTPGAEKTYTTRVLQRDRLQACLLEEIGARYSDRISIHHQTKCVGVDLSGAKPRVLRDDTAAAAGQGDSAEGGGSEEAVSSYDLIVGADGVRSAVRESLEAAAVTKPADGFVTGATKTVRFAEKNERRYKTLPLHPSAVPGTPTDLNWGFRNASLGLGMDALPTREGEMVAVLLFKPGSEVYDTIESLRTAAEARAFLSDAMPPLVPYLRDADLERFVQRPVSRLPTFQLVEGDIHRVTDGRTDGRTDRPTDSGGGGGGGGGGVVLLGDAIKAVKPYFGQGANSALEDVVVLDGCLDACGDDAPAAVAAEFTRRRAEDARALVRVSRSFDHPGPLGTARFLVPLLLDIQLNKLLPALFSPPLLRGLQDERNTFVGLVERKRKERAVLIGLIASVSYLVRAAVREPTGLASQGLYALSMVGVGYGGARVMRSAREGGGGAGSALAKLKNPRAAIVGAAGATFGLASKVVGAPLGLARSQLRALLLKLDPSLEEDEGDTLGWKDIPKPGLGKLGPKPPKPPWQKEEGSA